MMPRTTSSPGNQIAKRLDQPFFVGISTAIVIFVFVGFARTFYLHRIFGVPAPPSFMAFHGSLMSGWILLLFVQTALITSNRVHWHRRLGIVGAFYAVLIVVVGCMATLIAAAREVRAHSAMVASQLNVLALELTQMLLFACLVGAAVRLRNRYDWHKRLMLMATLCILPNVIVRLSFLTDIEFFTRNINLLGLWALTVILVVALDSYRRRRLHPAFGLVGALTIASLYAAYFVGITNGWVRFSTWLVS
jgi:hypothetical protein